MTRWNEFAGITTRVGCDWNSVPDVLKSVGTRYNLAVVFTHLNDRDESSRSKTKGFCSVMTNSKVSFWATISRSYSYER